MNSLINKISITLLLLMVLAMGCEKKLDTTLNLPRPFTPTQVSSKNAETSATISWRPSLFAMKGDVSYKLEVSTDSSFASSQLSLTVDSTAIILTDNDLEIKTKYFARVKAVNNAGSESAWAYSSSFQILGEQVFFALLDAELKDKSVVLRWKATDGLTKIVLTPDGGTAIEIPLDATDLTNQYKEITGLTATTAYTAVIYKSNVEKGTISFTTKEPSIYSTVLNPGDNLVDAVANAADGDLIGLSPGTYDCVDGTGAFTNIAVIQKTISILSTSGDPADTKVNFKEITLKGDGAGITLNGINFDGAPSTASGQASLYFINLTGLSSDSGPASFTNITVENCRVHNMANAFMRGNRGGSNGAHKIGEISINNSFVYNSAQVNTNYSLLQINKLQFASIKVTNSTLYSIGRCFLDWDATFSVSPRPTVLVDQCTINNFGLAGQSYILFDVNQNDVQVTMQNSIVANTPYPSEQVSSLIRADMAMISISNSNYFNLMDGAAPTPAPLTIPSYVVESNNTMIDLGWTSATSDFTLPAGSPLRTASTSGGAIGDRRWAF